MRHQNVVIRCLILASALVGSYAVNVSSVARLLCYRLNFSLEACTQPVVSNGVRCGPLLSVFFPSSFTVRQCVDRSSLVCFEGEELSTRTLKQLFVAMACAFEGAPTSLQPRLARHLACPLVELLRLALRQFAEVLTWPLFAEQIRDSVEQLATLLLHLASCQNGTTPTTSSTANTMSTLPASSMKEDQGSTTNAVSTRSASSDPTSTAVSSSSSATGSALNWNETTTAANTSAAATSASVRTATMLSTPTPAPTTTSSEAITNITSISTVIFSTNVTTVATNSESASSTITLATISSPDESSSSANSSPTLPAMGTSGFLTGEQENSTNSGNTGISINVTTVSTNSDSTSSINTFSTTSSPEGSLSTTNTGPAGTSFGTSGSITAAQEMGTNSGNATHSTTPAQPEGTSNFPTTINATVSVTTNAGVTTSRSPTLSSSAAPSDESPTILGSSPEIPPSLTPMSSTMLSTSPPIATQTSSSSISEAMPSSLPTPPQESTPGAITASAESSEQTRDEPGSTASVTVSTRSGSTPTNTLTAQTNLVTTVGTGTSGQADPSSIPEGTSSTSPSFTQLSSTVAGSTMTQAGDDRSNTTSTQQYLTSQSTAFSVTVPAISTATDITNCILVAILGDAPPTVLSGILCEVSSVLAQKVRQLPFFSFLRTLLNPVLQLLRRIVGSCHATNNSLARTRNCFKEGRQKHRNTRKTYASSP
ncbi:hypothetical protein V5799_003114 [Amblyomma americanum]|uniref:Uncharacterized protein n=1 Tax=Amblyomma americanum TaxID=6943 RepID=A0AAQ4D9W6_AMBAM